MQLGCSGRTHLINRHGRSSSIVVGQVALKVSHGLQDYIILADFAFISLLEELRSKLSTVKYFIITTDEGHMPQSTPGGAWLCYDTLVRGPLCGKP